MERLDEPAMALVFPIPQDVRLEWVPRGLLVTGCDCNSQITGLVAAFHSHAIALPSVVLTP